MTSPYVFSLKQFNQQRKYFNKLYIQRRYSYMYFNATAHSPSYFEERIIRSRGQLLYMALNNAFSAADKTNVGVSNRFLV